jgi:uncharacterized protein (TIGR00251 family)
VLAVHVQPGASASAVVGEHGDALKIRLAAPPIDGRANAALIEFLARRLGVGRAAVTLVRGQTSRAKQLRVAGLDAPAVCAALLGQAGSSVVSK